MKNTVKEIVSQTLQAEGFKKKADSWYFDRPETILVFNLQKSQYANCYFVNLGIWCKAVGTEQFPKENACHVRTRLNSIGGDALDEPFNLESCTMTEEERRLRLRDAISTVAVPFLLSCDSAEKLMERIRLGSMRGVLVSRKVGVLYGMQNPDQGI